MDKDCEVVFISDLNIGLLESLPKVFPGSGHYYCLEYLKNNFRDKFRGSAYSSTFREHLIWLFSECAHAVTESLFKDKLTELKQKGGATVDRFLKDLPVENWTNAYGKVCHFGEMSSNAAESFNAWIVEARSLPITNMVDLIRVKLMCWFSDQRDQASRWDSFLCPRMAAKLRNLVLDGKSWNVRKCSSTIFEIFSDPSVRVDIGRRVCSCRQWQLNGFPCAHAVVAIGRSDKNIDDYVDRYFYKSTSLKVYETLIHPIPTISMSEQQDSVDDDILPPITRRQARRPRKRRFKSSGERVNPIKCGRCSKLGNHNKKTCKEPLE